MKNWYPEHAHVVLEWSDLKANKLRLLSGRSRLNGFGVWKQSDTGDHDIYRLEFRDYDSMGKERWTHDACGIPSNALARVVETLLKEKAILQGKLDAVSKVLEGKS